MPGWNDISDDKKKDFKVTQVFTAASEGALFPASVRTYILTPSIASASFASLNQSMF